MGRKVTKKRAREAAWKTHALMADWVSKDTHGCALTDKDELIAREKEKQTEEYHRGTGVGFRHGFETAQFDLLEDEMAKVINGHARSYVVGVRQAQFLLRILCDARASSDCLAYAHKADGTYEEDEEATC